MGGSLANNTFDNNMTANALNSRIHPGAASRSGLANDFASQSAPRDTSSEPMGGNARGSLEHRLGMNAYPDPLAYEGGYEVRNHGRSDNSRERNQYLQQRASQ